MDIRKWFSPDKLEPIKTRSPDTDKTHEILSPKWEVIKVFTDGSTINNGDKNARQWGGIGIFFADNDPRNISKSVIANKITNNICELLACRLAIEIILKTHPDISNVLIKLYTDSEYTINCLTKWCINWEKNGWKNAKNKAVKNEQLIKSIKGLMKKCRIQFIHVSAHQEEPKNRYKYPEKYELWYGNYMADKFARDASEQSNINSNISSNIDEKREKETKEVSLET